MTTLSYNLKRFQLTVCKTDWILDIFMYFIVDGLEWGWHQMLIMQLN